MAPNTVPRARDGAWHGGRGICVALSAAPPLAQAASDRAQKHLEISKDVLQETLLHSGHMRCDHVIRADMSVVLPITECLAYFMTKC